MIFAKFKWPILVIVITVIYACMNSIFIPDSGDCGKEICIDRIRNLLIALFEGFFVASLICNTKNLSDLVEKK